MTKGNRKHQAPRLLYLLDAVRRFWRRKSLRPLFYLFRGKKARFGSNNLSHGSAGLGPCFLGPIPASSQARELCTKLARGRQVGQIAVGLLHRSQTVAHEKSLIHQKSEIVGL